MQARNRRRRLAWFLAVLGAFNIAGCASAGPVGVETLVPGTRVRTAATGDAAVDGPIVRRVNGYFDVSARPGGDVARIEVAGVARLEAYAGRDRVRGGLTGIAVALPAGIAGGMLCARRCTRTERGARVTAPAQGALAGTAIGVGVGMLLAPERWRIVLIR